MFEVEGFITFQIIILVFIHNYSCLREKCFPSDPNIEFIPMIFGGKQVVYEERIGENLGFIDRRTDKIFTFSP